MRPSSYSSHRACGFIITVILKSLFMGNRTHSMEKTLRPKSPFPPRHIFIINPSEFPFDVTWPSCRPVTALIHLKPLETPLPDALPSARRLAGARGTRPTGTGLGAEGRASSLGPGILGSIGARLRPCPGVCQNVLFTFSAEILCLDH